MTDADRRNAATARLEALETDHDSVPAFQESDEEFVLDDSDEGTHSFHAEEALPDRLCFQWVLCCSDEPHLGKSRGKRRGKLNRTRKTRGMLADKQKGPKSFAVLLEEVVHTCAECTSH